MTFFLWSQFAIVCLLGAMSPGPSLALIIRNSINYNRISGIIASIAHGLGICVYATITVIILEFILQNNEEILCSTVGGDFSNFEKVKKSCSLPLF